MPDIFRVNHFTTDIEKRIYKNGLYLIALFSALALVFFPWKISLSILVGGLLAVLNFHWLKQGIDVAIFQEKRTAIKGILFKYVLRLVLILSILYGSIYISLNVLAVLLGLGVFIIGTLIEGIYQVIKTYHR